MARSSNTSNWSIMSAIRKRLRKAEVTYSFDRRDHLDVAALKRLVNSLCRFLDPEDALELQHQVASLKFVTSKSDGGLNTCESGLNIKGCFEQVLKIREFTAPIAEALFAMVANYTCFMD